MRCPRSNHQDAKLLEGMRKLPLDRAKLKGLVHYACRTCSGGPLEKTSLHWILWCSDAAAYTQNGQSITGEAYLMGASGPSARHLHYIVAELMAERLLYVRDVQEGGHARREFIARGHVDPTFMTQTERSVVDTVIRHFVDGHAIDHILAIWSKEAATARVATSE